MKVVFISTHFRKNGAAKSCRRIATALYRHTDCEMSMIVRKAEDVVVDNVYEFATGTKKYVARLLEKYEVLRYQLNESSKNYRYYFSLDYVGQDIAEHPAIQNADILHLNWINNGFLSLKSMAALQALGKPIVWSMHDMWPFTGGCHYSGDCRNYELACNQCFFLNNPGPTDMAWKSWNRKKDFYKNLNWKFIATSNWLMQEASKSPLLENADVRVVPNPVDTDFFSPKDKMEMRKRLGLPTDKKLILFVAMDVNESRKGFTFLEHALWHLRQERPICIHEYAIVTMGRISQPILEKLSFKQYHLGFLEAEEKMVAAYNACDVYIMPSLEDNLPNTVLEASACGLPVVAFNTGGIPEMVEHHKSGFLAKRLDVLDLANGIEWVLGEDRDTLGTFAREKMLRDFSFPVIAKQYKLVYDSLF